MWRNEVSLSIPATADAVFAVWTDFPARPTWDEHDEWLRLDGPLAIGTTMRTKTPGAPAARVRITALDPDRRIVTEGQVPFGRLRFSFEVARIGPAAVLATYRQELEGPASPLLARLFGPRIAADAPVTLERLAHRMAALQQASK